MNLVAPCQPSQVGIATQRKLRLVQRRSGLRVSEIPPKADLESFACQLLQEDGHDAHRPRGTNPLFSALIEHRKQRQPRLERSLKQPIFAVRPSAVVEHPR
jgi:hypothetical protein